ncbi:MAG: hypothetical protein ACYC5Q_10110 [Thermoleophilia bacterium]
MARTAGWLMGIALPTLSEVDPEAPGEGSLDPLGLAPVADRLADLLAPDVRARMYRIRFVTAIAVGVVVTEALWDEPAVDGVSTPPICFEWVVLESFVRKAAETGALEGYRIPGSGKATAVIAQGKRLGAGNYLKTPSVFGFNGVYQPLARGMRVVDDKRMCGERTGELVSAWERDQSLSGFLDSRPGSRGAQLRSWLTDATRAALREGYCAAAPASHLWTRVAGSLAPLRSGAEERALLRAWLLDPDQAVRHELAVALEGLPAAEEEPFLLRAVCARASTPLRQRIEAVLAYEAFCGRLDAVFGTLRHVSTLQGTQPVTLASASSSSVVQQAARELPDAYRRLAAALEQVELAAAVTDGLAVFAEHLAPGDLAEEVLGRHTTVQRDKGKREWFEQYGPGLVVRPPYRQNDAVEIRDDRFLHPFRVNALWQFMEDTRR